MMKLYCSILDVLYACGPYHLIYTEPLLAVCFFYITFISFVSNSVNHIFLCCICSVVKSLLCHFVALPFRYCCAHFFSCNSHELGKLFECTLLLLLLGS